MSNTTDDLLHWHRAGELSRRDLLRRLSRIGYGAAAATLLLGQAGTRAMAADGFDWKQHRGARIRLLLSKHPYAAALIAGLPDFRELTGIEVTYDLYPEDIYFDKVDVALEGQGTIYDVFMTGAYQTWSYGPRGQIVDLNEYIMNPRVTAPTYAFEDMLPNLRAALAWSGITGEELGAPGAKQLGLPWGFELNSISYNRRILKQAGMTPPGSLPELIEQGRRISAGSNGIYGIGVRGSRSWATIHSGYMSGLTNYGGSDFVGANGGLRAAMNSKPCVEFTRLWVEMIRGGGSPNWRSATWYEIAADLGAGTSAMIYDADILGLFSNRDTNEAGNIGYDGFVPNPSASVATPNIWVWSLAMNAVCTRRNAAWDFMQWATSAERTLFGAIDADLVNPVRKSAWDNAAFGAKMNENDPGYLAQYKAIVEHARVYITPQTHFLETGTLWAASLQKMVADRLDIAEGLDQLAATLDLKLDNQE